MMRYHRLKELAATRTAVVQSAIQARASDDSNTTHNHTRTASDARLTRVRQGWGLIATQLSEKGDMIIEYIGERVRRELSEIRERQYNHKVDRC